MENKTIKSTSHAQIVQGSSNLQIDMDFLNGIGFRLDQIFPADNPTVAIMSGHGLQIRLDKEILDEPSIIHIISEDPEMILNGSLIVTAPNGTLYKVFQNRSQMVIPETHHKFEVRRLVHDEPWVIGRAGMKYRDLILDRLGGSIIASHIHIPVGGPVPDMVHYHTIGFQLIFCYKGWVRLVYEDQGPPFILHAGDCVTQPPEIRHQVLESSDNLEVIEIGIPATHMTTIDHDMELPTDKLLPERKFQGQKFCHHVSKEAAWKDWKIPGFQFRDTGVYVASNEIASVIVIRKNETDTNGYSLKHQGDILFYFVMDGSLHLSIEDNGTHLLSNGDAFVIPPDLSYTLEKCSTDVELLEVFLPFSLK